MRKAIYTAAMAAGLAFLPSMALAQVSHNVRLHVNPKWDECAFQLDPALTQKAWHQFAAEAGLTTYFRSLTDARPMGAGKWEVSALQWETGIDDTDSAWNDTFVHPDSTHWLLEGNGLKFPGLMLRSGLTDRIDVGAYFTKNQRSNYGFYGGQLQYNMVREASRGWSAAARLSFVSLYGPTDLNLTVYGADLVASKAYSRRWVTVSPYAGVSSYLSTARESTAAVNLADENVLGMQAMVGAVAQVSVARIAVEYSTARVRSRSLKVGISF